MPYEEHMLTAIKAAHKAYAEGDYAVGCVIATDDQIVAIGANRTHLDVDATQHAEIIAIRKAAEVLKTKKLSTCSDIHIVPGYMREACLQLFHQ